MKIYERYVAQVVLTNTLMVLLVLVSLLMFFAFLDELRSAGEGNYGVWQAAQFVLMSCPRVIYELFPMSVLLGSLLGLGAMANNSELVAMRAAGISVYRIILASMKVGILMMVFVALIGEFLSPFMEQKAQQMKAFAISQKVALLSQNGFWARNDQTYINVKEILPGPVLKDITIYELNTKNIIASTIHAKRATYQENAWLMEDINQDIISNNQIETLYYKETRWKSLLNPELLKVVTVKPDALSGLGLFRYIQYLNENGLDAMRYELAFWKKIINPFDLMIMLLLAVPFVFGAPRAVSVGQRVMVGILIGIVFTIANRAFGHMGLVYQFNPFFSAIFPSILFLSIAIFSVNKVAK